MINRCHRGKKKRDDKPRPIYTNMCGWRDCEKIVKTFRFEKLGLVDFKYGARTTKRRGMALAKRKQLKDDGEIISGYLKYPAVLWVKKNEGEKYVWYQDFSKEKVTFGKKN